MMVENSRKCSKCETIGKLVKFLMILRINGRDFRFLCFYCNDCFNELEEYMDVDIKVKLFIRYKTIVN